MGDYGTTAKVATMALYGRHLVKRAQEGLFGATLLPMLGNQIPLPGHAGREIFIPKDYPLNRIKALTEGTPIGVCPPSGHYYTGCVVGYGDARGYGDFLVSIHEVPSMVSNDIATMSRYLGYKYDSLCRVQLCAVEDVWVSPDGGATTQGGATGVHSTTSLTQRFLFDASTTLASNDAPTYSDGNYVGVFHPRATHDLFVSTSAGSQLGKGLQTTAGGAGSFLELTEAGVGKLERASLGVLGRIRILESTRCPVRRGGSDQGTASIAGLESGESGVQAFVFGPGAYAAVDLENQRPKVFLKGFGSGGTYDPINQLSTAGIKGYFTAIAMDTANRLVRTCSGKTI